MKYQCYIVDDEALPASLIIDYVNRHEDLELIAYEPDPAVALSQILSGNVKPDICFLDVQMAGINGIELAKLIKHVTTVIFTTGYRDYAPESYEAEAIDYLLKPVRYVRFLEAVEKAKRDLAKNRSALKKQLDLFFVKDVLQNKMLMIKLDNLVAIEGNGNYVLLHILGAKKSILTNMTMGAIIAKAQSDLLVQVHKKFIVNLSHVVALTGNEITLSGDKKVILSRRQRNLFISSLNGNIDI